MLQSDSDTSSLLYNSQGESEEADALHVQAIEIWENALGCDHPDLATHLDSRASFLEDKVRAAGFAQPVICCVGFMSLCFVSI